jgi:hypothetical protein
VKTGLVFCNHRCCCSVRFLVDKFPNHTAASHLPLRHRVSRWRNNNSHECKWRATIRNCGASK